MEATKLMALLAAFLTIMSTSTYLVILGFWVSHSASCAGAPGVDLALASFRVRRSCQSTFPSSHEAADEKSACNGRGGLPFWVSKHEWRS